jgi:hypothetical protein
MNRLTAGHRNNCNLARSEFLSAKTTSSPNYSENCVTVDILLMREALMSHCVLSDAMTSKTFPTFASPLSNFAICGLRRYLGQLSYWNAVEGNDVFARGLSSSGEEVLVNPDQVLYVRPASFLYKKSALILTHGRCLTVDQNTQTVRQRFEDYLKDVGDAGDGDEAGGAWFRHIPGSLIGPFQNGSCRTRLRLLASAISCANSARISSKIRFGIFGSRDHGHRRICFHMRRPRMSAGA